MATIPQQSGHRYASPFTATVSYPNAGTAVCTAAGEVDLCSAPELVELLREATSNGPRHVAVDLSAVTFFSAAGLHALDGARSAQGPEHTVVLVGAGRPVTRILHVCDFEYRRYHDLASALTALDEPVPG